MNVDKICEEIVWYSRKDEETGMWIIPVVIDFDFTITKESSWLKGTFTENDHCIETMHKWEKKYGVKFILETMRGENHIKPALDFCKSKGINFFGIGRNPLQDADGYTTCKCWGIWDIDDRNFSIPLICPECGRPYVDWFELDKVATPIIKQVFDRLPFLEDEILKNKEKVLK